MNSFRRKPIMIALAAVMATGPQIQPVMALQQSAGAAEAELLIYGDIGDSWWGESVTALSVVQQLGQLDPSVTQINVRINSLGGSVADGLAIYNALKRASARKVVTVDGVAMSSASLIAMAGDEVNMPSTSILMIHAPWGYASGNSQDMREMAAVLDTFADAMASAYVAKSGQPREDMLALLQDGADHYFTGDQAVAQGFADAVVAAEADADDANARLTTQAMAAGVERLLANAPDDIRRLAVAASARHPARLPKPRAASARSNAHGADEILRVITQQAAAVRAALNITGESTMPNANTAGPANTAANEAEIQAQALARVAQRNADIKAMVSPYLARDGVQAIYMAALEDPNATVDNVRAKVLDHIGAQTAPIASTRVELMADEDDKFRDAGQNAILARAGLVKADGQNPLRGMALREIARASLSRKGQRADGMDIREVVAAAFTTTSDFPALLVSTARMALLKGYDEAPETFPLFTRPGTLTDFKPAQRAGLGSFSSLDKVGEHGEYKHGTFGSAGQSIVLATYGKLFAITRQAIINDDLGAFTAVPQKMGRAAKRTIGDLVFAILTGNPALSDNVALFHATHKNLLTGASITSDSVDAMRVAMKTQKVDGKSVNVPLQYLLVPVALEGLANTVRTSQYKVDGQNNNATIPNSVANTFQVISDARLDDASPKVWYGSADPTLYDTIEVAYLDGVQEPFLEQKDGWNVDGTEFKVRIDAGVAPLDFRGLAKNPGT